jgi:hypothetical protein
MDCVCLKIINKDIGQRNIFFKYRCLPSGDLHRYGSTTMDDELSLTYLVYEEASTVDRDGGTRRISSQQSINGWHILATPDIF